MHDMGNGRYIVIEYVAPPYATQLAHYNKIKPCNPILKHKKIEAEQKQKHTFFFVFVL
jgi:hypothetical protein